MSTHCPGCHEGIKVYTKSALDTVQDHVHIYPCPGCGHEAEIARLTADLRACAEALEAAYRTLHMDRRSDYASGKCADALARHGVRAVLEMP